jgi:hypothetical protein
MDIAEVLLQHLIEFRLGHRLLDIGANDSLFDIEEKVGPPNKGVLCEVLRDILYSL